MILTGLSWESLNELWREAEGAWYYEKHIQERKKKKRKHMQMKEILLCKNGLRSVSDTAGADLIGLINLLKKLKS